MCSKLVISYDPDFHVNNNFETENLCLRCIKPEVPPEDKSSVNRKEMASQESTQKHFYSWILMVKNSELCF